MIYIQLPGFSYHLIGTDYEVWGFYYQHINADIYIIQILPRALFGTLYWNQYSSKFKGRLTQGPRGSECPLILHAAMRNIAELPRHFHHLSLTLHSWPRLFSLLLHVASRTNTNMLKYISTKENIDALSSSGEIRSVRDEKRANCWKIRAFKYQRVIFIHPLSTVYYLKKKNFHN